MSGAAKVLALGLTYPYQVVRSRIQVGAPFLSLSHISYRSDEQNKSLNPEETYKSIPDCISKTYRREGLRAFYNGLATNCIRILPGTCGQFRFPDETMARLG